jgi:hypothetical protein
MGKLEWKDIITINKYAPNVGTPSLLKQTLWDIVEGTDSDAIKVSDFNTLSHH